MENCLNFSDAELKVISMAITGGVSGVATLGLAYCAKVLYSWLSWRR